MRKRLAGFLLACALAGCGPKHASFVKVDDVALGRVVVYRNGVAYYERRTTVSGGALTVRVPRDRVDDFLKSLTVVDAISHQPLPVSIPRDQSDDGAYLIMKLQLPSKDKADVVLTYVTEAPAWKPSYRVVVGDNNKVMLEGWAVVDNTSGEDWKGVFVGVGSSSALSFRYDLWSVRNVQRETLQAEERFAVAPPTGISPYGGTAEGNAAAVAELDDREIRRPDGHPENKASKRIASRDDADSEKVEATGSVDIAKRSGGGGRKTKAAAGREPSVASPTPQSAPPKDAPTGGAFANGDAKMRQLAAQFHKNAQTIVVEGYGNTSRGGDANQRALDRANLVRNQLIEQGIAPSRIRVIAKVGASENERVRLVAEAPKPADKSEPRERPVDSSAPPVGESHFASPTPMTVERGASAMVSMVRGETEGEVVYLYDAESARGNDQFAFRAVRFRNPTTSTLETGPVTVYGNERFIGEGLTEPIPPKASAVVPYALDRQIVVEKNDGEENRIQKLVTIQRGVLTAQVQHIRRKKLALTNRMNQPAKVFIRHTVNKGWTLVDAPKNFERIGDAHLFAVQLGPHEVTTVEIAEATPLERTLDLNADVTLEMMRVYVEAPEGSDELKGQLRKLLKIHRALIDHATEQESMRRRLTDYRERMDELHAQIVTLQAVKAGNDLLANLKNKMKDISTRVQKTTIDIVNLEEKIMLARIEFQDMLAELSLGDATAPAPRGPATAKTKG